MTVAELIAKLQEMPQDILVYGHDNEEGPTPISSATMTIVNAWDTEVRTEKSGFQHVAMVPSSLREIQAVVIA